MGYIRDHGLLYAKYLDRAIERALGRDDAQMSRAAIFRRGEKSVRGSPGGKGLEKRRLIPLGFLLRSD